MGDRSALWLALRPPIRVWVRPIPLVSLAVDRGACVEPETVEAF